MDVKGLREIWSVTDLAIVATATTAAGVPLTYLFAFNRFKTLCICSRRGNKGPFPGCSRTYFCRSRTLEQFASTTTAFSCCGASG